MSHFAAAVMRRDSRWTATDVDLIEAADIEDVTERLRETDLDASTVLLFVECDDLYLVIMRLDDGEDLRIFGSDAAFASDSRLGAVLLGEIKEPALDLDDESFDEEGEDSNNSAPSVPEVEPIGDPDLLSDFGISASRLLRLCAMEGMLPADITSEVCQGIGCGDEVEELREA